MERAIKPLAILLASVAFLLVVQVALSGTILMNIRRMQQSGAATAQAAQQVQPVHSDGAAMEPTLVQDVSLADAFVRGKADAPVTIVEFSDFQCPYCGQEYPVLKEILKNYDGKVKLAYRHYPLGIHENAYSAALAAEAAGEQGKFWEMHDLLFDNAKTDGGKALTREKLTSYAEALHLDMKRFNEAMDGERFGPKVKSDAQDAEKYGVTGTPTLFVNGRKVIGAMSYDEMNRIIQEELAKVNGK